MLFFRTYPLAYRYGVAFINTIISLLLTLSIGPFIPQSSALFPVLGVIVTVWLVGLGPALLAAAFGAFIVNYFLVPPFESLQLARPDALRLIWMSGVALIFHLLARYRDRHSMAAEVTQQIYRLALDSSPVPVVILDRNRQIITANAAWRHLMENCGLFAPDAASGADYRPICRRLFGETDGDAERAAVGIEAVITGERDEFSLEHSWEHGEAQHWFKTTAYRLVKDRRNVVAVTHEDITEQRAVEALRAEESRMTAWCNGILRATTSSGSVQGYCERCTSVIARLLDVVSAQIWLYDSSSEHLSLGGATGANNEIRAIYPIGSVLQDRNFIQIDNLQKDPAFQTPAWAPRASFLSFTGYPLQAGKRPIGVLALFTPGPVDQVTVEILKPISRAIAHGLAQKLSEEQRAEFAAGLKLLFESTGEGIFGVDMEGRCSFINRAGAEMLGYARETLIGRNMHELIHHHRPDGTLYPEEECPILQTFRLGAPSRVDSEQMWRSDGSSFPVEYLSYPVTEDGTVRGAVITFNDTSGRRRGEKIRWLLFEASTRLAASLDYGEALDEIAHATVPLLADACAFYLTDEEGALQRVAAAEASTKDKRLLPVLEQVNPATPGPSHPVTLAMQTKETGYHLKFPMQGALGNQLEASPVNVTYTVVPVKARGRCLGALSLVSVGNQARVDIPEPATAEELARRAAAAIDNAQLYLDAEAAAARERERALQLRGLTHASLHLNSAPSHEMILGLLTEWARDLIGAAHVIAFLTPASARAAPQRISHLGKPVLQERELGQLCCLAITCLGENTEPVRLTPHELRQAAARAKIPLAIEDQLPLQNALIVPLCGRDGERIGVLHLLNHQQGTFTEEDASILLQLARLATVAIENLRLYQETEQALRVRDQFITAAAHELKTPITSMLGYAALLQRRRRDDEALDKRTTRGLEIIQQEATRLNRLIDSLLDVSRIQTGRPIVLDRKPVELCTLVSEHVEKVRLTLQAHQVQLHLPDRPHMVNGDALRLEQVVENLLQNAIKFSPKGGTIRLQLVREKNQICLSISDDGLGIPDAALPRLFSRYHRAGNAVAEGLDGLGLGLHVSYQIIKAHGGSIQVASTEGSGSTFMVRLPIHPGTDL